MTISLNPGITTNAAGLFSVTEDGLVQGTMFDDPVARYALSGGVLDPTETLPMWGGVGVFEKVPLSTAGSSTASDTFGGYVGRATSVTAAAAKQLTGFSVFNQGYNGIITPQSPVPLLSTGMGVNLLRLGSGARIAVAVDPVLISLDGGIITQQVSWDFAQQRLIPYQAAYNANVITAASWASTGGGQITFTTTTNHGLSVGSVVTISGFTPDGYNGTYTTLAGTATDQIVVAKTVDPGSDTVQGQLDAGGGALPCKILSVQASGCMTVSYDEDTNFATWSPDGACAVILI